MRYADFFLISIFWSLFVLKLFSMLCLCVCTRMCSDPAAGGGWIFWAAGRKFWTGEWRYRQTGRGRRRGERCQTRVTAADEAKMQAEVISRRVTCTFHSGAKEVNVSHLDDQEERRGWVKGPVVEGDDGGAAGAEQVSYLERDLSWLFCVQYFCHFLFDCDYVVLDSQCLFVCFFPFKGSWALPEQSSY